ncbi:MAG: lytic transglycosylase domain-containing protein [Solirubrobacteraceae bacterium]
MNLLGDGLQHFPGASRKRTLTRMCKRSLLLVALLAVISAQPAGANVIHASILGGTGRTERLQSGAQNGTSPSGGAQTSVSTSGNPPTGGVGLGGGAANTVGAPAAGAQPTLQRVTASQIALIARQNGVPALLAEAVAWQESGWNNDEVSSRGAVGVMQITTATWCWVNEYLTPGDPLNARSAVDNIRAGVLLLRELLHLTGRTRLAIAAYFQGLTSIQRHGLFSATKRYVANVLAIERKLAR